MADTNTFNPVVEARKNPSWDLSGYTDQQLFSHLSDPAKFRQIFPNYSSMSDDEIRSGMTRTGLRNPVYTSATPTLPPDLQALIHGPGNMSSFSATKPDTTPLALTRSGPLKSAQSAVQSSTQDIQNKGLRGEISPLESGVGTFTGGVYHDLLGLAGQPFESGKNAALTVLQAHPVTRAFSAPYNLYQGAKAVKDAMTSPMEPGETAADRIQKGFLGGAMVSGATGEGLAGVKPLAGRVYGAVTRNPEAAVSATAAQMHPDAVTGARQIYKAAAPVGSDPGFLGDVHAAAGDLNEIGQKLEAKFGGQNVVTGKPNILGEAQRPLRPGEKVAPDMRVRAAVDGIDEHLEGMYQRERAPQVQRNAQVPVGLNGLGADEIAGLRYMAKNGATAAERAVATNAMNNGVLSIQELDQLSRNVSRQLQDYNGMTPQDRAQTAGLNKRIAGIKALDTVVKDRLDNALQMRGEGGVQNYRQRYAALSSVRDQLRARINMAELQPNPLSWAGVLKAFRGKGAMLAGASQAAISGSEPGDLLEQGFQSLKKSGITPTRDVGSGAQPIAGLLGPGATPSTAGGRVGPGGPTAIPLGAHMEPIGTPSAPPPILEPQIPGVNVRPNVERLEPFSDHPAVIAAEKANPRFFSKNEEPAPAPAKKRKPIKYYNKNELPE